MKHWGKLLQPNLFLGNSILAITPELLQQHQIKGLILDVDETLVPFGQREPTLEVQQWAQDLQRSVKLVLLSNNINQTRIHRIASALELPYFTGAGKPSRRKLRLAAAILGLPPDQIAMVGDRLFTDVLAGNRLGMFTILVDPMGNPVPHNPKLCVRNLEIWVSSRLGVILQVAS